MKVDGMSEKQIEMPIKSLVKSVNCILDALRGITPLQSPRNISLVTPL